MGVKVSFLYFPTGRISDFGVNYLYLKSTCFFGDLLISDEGYYSLYLPFFFDEVFP